MVFDPSTAKPVKFDASTARPMKFDPSTAKPVEAPTNPRLGGLESIESGAMGMGSREPGAVLSEATDVAFGGTPRNILRYPGAFAFGGVPAANAKEAMNTADYFGGAMSGANAMLGNKRRFGTSGAEAALPSPKGISGKVAGQVLGLAGAAGMSSIPGGGEPIRPSMTALEKAQPSIDLAHNLAEHAQGALDVSGENLHGALNASPQNVDLTKIQRVMDNLPPKVQFDIAKNPEITRVGDMLEPTMRNAELIRAHINNHLPYVDFNGKAPLQQAYADMGTIMREAAPETQPLFENYAKTKAAHERLTVALKVLKKFPSADVASAAVVALDRVVIAFAATCPSDKADFTKPNFEICAVVTSASAWMRFSA